MSAIWSTMPPPKKTTPKRLSKKLRKVCKQRGNCDEDYFAQGPVMIITSRWELGVWMPKGCVCTTLFENGGDLSNIYSGGLEVWGDNDWQVQCFQQECICLHKPGWQVNISICHISSFPISCLSYDNETHNCVKLCTKASSTAFRGYKLFIPSHLLYFLVALFIKHCNYGNNNASVYTLQSTSSRPTSHCQFLSYVQYPTPRIALFVRWLPKKIAS